MARTKQQPPQKTKAKAKVKTKVALSGSPTTQAANKTKRAIAAAKQCNATSYSIDNIRQDKDDVVKMLSHRAFRYYLITSPADDEDDAYFAAQWNDETSITHAKGATWYNQIKVWTVAIENGTMKVDMVEPKMDSKVTGSDLVTESRVPELFTHFGLFIGMFEADMALEELIVAFRQWFFQMGKGSRPILRGIPSSKLLINMEETSEEIIMYALSFKFFFF